MDDTAPKLTAAQLLKALAASVGAMLLGGALFILATASNTIFPVLALISVGLVILGGLGAIVVVLTVVVGRLFGSAIELWIRGMEDRADRRRAERVPAWMLQYDAGYQMREQRRRREAAQAQGAALLPEMSPSVHPAPPTPRPSPAPAPAPTRSPQAPAPASAESERPTTIQPGPPGISQTYTDYTAPSPFDYVAPGEDYSTWTTEALRDRLAGLDYGAMGMAMHMGGVPDDMAQEMNAINAELSRRGTAS